VTFLADEGVDRQIVERLRLDGHEVSYVAEMAPGITDEVVLSESRKLAERVDHLTKSQSCERPIVNRRQATSLPHMISASSSLGSGKRRPAFSIWRIVINRPPDARASFWF